MKKNSKFQAITKLVISIFFLIACSGSIFAENNSLASNGQSADAAVELQKEQKTNIIEIAKKWVGTPYARSGSKYAGKKAKRGVSGGGDCSGIIYKIYFDAGYKYGYQSISNFVATSGGGHFKAIAKSQLQPGDIMVWSHSYKTKYQDKYYVKNKAGKKIAHYKTKYKTVSVTHMAIYDKSIIWSVHPRSKGKFTSGTVSSFSKDLNNLKPNHFYSYISDASNKSKVLADDSSKAIADSSTEVQDDTEGEDSMQVEAGSAPIADISQIESSQPAQKKSIIEIAKEWVGTPYARSGTRFSGKNATKGSSGGADCSGVTARIYSEAGYGYGYQSVSQFVATSGNGHFKAITREELQPGDIVIWLYYHKVKYRTKYYTKTKSGKKKAHYITKHKTIRISHMVIFDESCVWSTHSRSLNRLLAPDSIESFVRGFHGLQPNYYYHYIGYNASSDANVVTRIPGVVSSSNSSEEDEGAYEETVSTTEDSST